MNLRSEKDNYIEDATPAEIKELQKREANNIVEVPVEKWEKLVRESQNYRILATIYMRKEETYELDTPIKTMLDMEGQKTLKQIRKEMFDLELKEKLFFEKQEKANPNKVEDPQTESDGGDSE